MMSNSLLSIAEACRRLSIGRSTLYTRIAHGDIGAVKFGSRTLIAETEIDRIVEAGARQANATLRRAPLCGRR
jgi:excisionase family DNA binding protein